MSFTSPERTRRHILKARSWWKFPRGQERRNPLWTTLLCGTFTFKPITAGPEQLARYGSRAGTESFKQLGIIEPNARPEQVLAAWTSWENLAREIFTQWRWDHDREALIRDEQAAIEQAKAAQTQAAQRDQERVNASTLESLLKKRRFAFWKGDRPDQAIGACRKAIHDAISALIALGPKPRKRAVTGVIRRCVERLNALDEQYDGFIETGEREALCREIDEMVYVSGLRGCDGMADEWREW